MTKHKHHAVKYEYGNTIIRADGVGYEYHHYERDPQMALDDVNIKVKKGEFLAIIGHNGSGKSTLAKCFNALLQPTKGTICVKGMSTHEDEFIWDIRQSAGMVFQNPDNQLVASVVEEDIAFGPENLGIEPSEIRKRVDAALDAVDMSEYKKSSPHYLSGGQKQRIAIAGIIAMHPEIIIFDEPTAMLDPVGRKEVMKTAHMLNKEEGITIIHITHYMDEVVDADRVFVMDKGTIAMYGTPKEVFSRVEELKKIGLDVPQVTDLIYRLQLKGCDLPDGIIHTDELVEALCRYL